MSEPFYISDTIQLKHIKKFGILVASSYFKIRVNEVPTIEVPFEVELSCYCVPGRIDKYSFSVNTFWAGVKFGTESGIPLDEAIRDCIADLNRPKVVKFLVNTCQNIQYSRLYFARKLELLLGRISNNTRSLEAISRLVMREERKRKREREARHKAKSRQQA